MEQLLEMPNSLLLDPSTASTTIHHRQRTVSAFSALAAIRKGNGISGRRSFQPARERCRHFCCQLLCVWRLRDAGLWSPQDLPVSYSCATLSLSFLFTIKTPGFLFSGLCRTPITALRSLEHNSGRFLILFQKAL